MIKPCIAVLLLASATTWGQPLPPPTAPPLPHPTDLALDIYEVDRKGNIYTVPVASPSYTQLYAQMSTYWIIVGLDWHSTSRGLARGGREANPFLSDAEGNLRIGRYVVLNAAAGTGLALVGRFVAPKLPRGPRRLVNGMVWAMLGGRAVVVVENYRKGSRLR